MFMSIKPRVIIVEGPDRSGKTALARMIANKLNAAYFHAIHTKALDGQAQFDYLNNLIDNAKVCMTVSGLHVVFDRHWPSEQCYGSVLRGGSLPFGSFFADFIDLDAIYIFCQGNSKRYLENVDEKHPYSEKEYLQINEGYTKLAKCLIDCEENVYFYDIDKYGSTMEAFIASIKL